MEYYVAEHDRSVDVCLADVRECDLYIGVFAWRYGWVPKKGNRRRLSITELEYQEALKAKKTCLIFLLEPEVRWNPGWIDDDRTKIRRLRTLLGERHSPDLFRSADELGQLVAHAIHRWAEKASLPGHFRKEINRDHLRFLDSPCPGTAPDLANVEPFRLLLKDECQHEFPRNMSSAQFLSDNRLVAGGALTKAAVLLFTPRPDADVPGALVRCSAFGDGDRARPRSAVDVRGPISSQITACVSFVRQHGGTARYFVEGVGRTVDFDKFPMVCVRELLANAVCHRDYSDSSRNIHLRVFDDHLEILSPGSWVGATPLSGQVPLSAARSEPIARNPTLARLLALIKLVEREGGGLSRAISDCENKQSPEPLIEERDGFVKATIFSSETFGLISRGEDPGVGQRRVEVVKALEQERLALVLGKRSDADKLSAIRDYSSRDVRSAFRILRRVPGLAPDAVLPFLTEVRGWDGEDLTFILSEWLGRGCDSSEVVGMILTWLRDVSDPRVIAFAYYALAELRLPFEDAAFFSSCWHVAPTTFRPETVRVPATGPGVRFTMGGDESAPSEEHPPHEVELAPFRIGVTPITEEEYSTFSGVPSRSTSPMVGITWWEAWVYARWLGGHLPTEAQWECACRAGTTSRWWYGDDERGLDSVAWVDEGPDGEAHPVRRKLANPWGLYDVHGNVSEWCLDRYAPYLAGFQQDPRGPHAGSARVLRGGNAAAPPRSSRSSNRDRAEPSSTSPVTGFRVVFPDEAS